MATRTKKEVTNWVGWIYFASLMMIVVGLFQILAGLTALFRDNFYAVTSTGLLVLNYTAWGWIHIIVGAVIVIAGVLAGRGNPIGRTLAVLFVTLNLLSQVAFMSAYPLWAIIMIIIDVMILFAFLVHGAEVRE